MIDRTEPGVNWLVFNSEAGYANIVNMQLQKSKIYQWFSLTLSDTLQICFEKLD